MTDETFLEHLESAAPWAESVGVSKPDVSSIFTIILSEMDVTCLKEIVAVNRQPCLRRFVALVEECTGSIF